LGGAWAVLLLAGTLCAQAVPVASGARLDVAITPSGPITQVGLAVRDAEGAACWLQITPGRELPDESSAWFSLGVHTLDAAGSADVDLIAPTALLTGLPPVHLRAIFRRDGEIVQATTVSTTLTPEQTPQQPGDEEPQGEPLDFAWGLGGVAMSAGERVSLSQPWGDIVVLGADNAMPGHPDEAILFDSSQPTGGDNDLATPGIGPGNDKPLGMLVVIAEQVNGGGDGVVDDPDDEMAGGVLVFEFPGPVNIGSFEVVDVDLDEPGGEVRFYKDDVLLWTNPLLPLGDNSSQYVTGWRDATRMEVELTGSGGVGDLVVYPCEAAMNFDETSTGTPLGLEPGEELSGLGSPMSGLGIWFTARNNEPTHPDKSIVFDSAAPTGDDPDLETPGLGIDNLVPQRDVLVVAENDIDSEPDGLVDDPNAEDAGGMIEMNWYTSDGWFRGGTVVDVDIDETASFVVYLNGLGDPSVTIPLASLGDNSSQTIDVMVGPTRRVEFHCSGSAALAEMRVCPSFD